MKFFVSRLALIAGVAVAALGSTESPAAGIFDYNLVSFGDVSLTSEVEGASFIGGDLLGGSANFGIAQNNIVALRLVGDIVGSAPRSIGSGNDAQVGGDNAGGAIINLSGGVYYYDSAAIPGVVQAGTATPVAGLKNDLQTLGGDLLSQANAAQALLGGLPATGPNPAIVMNGNPVFSAVPAGPNNVAVFSIDDALFETNLGSIGLNFNGADTVVFNVSGADINLTQGTGNFVGGFNDASAGKILFNFYEAQTITINRQFYGAILSPDADLSAVAGAIDGSVIVSSLSSSVEIHLPTFSGNVPVPEPSSLALLGLGGLAALSRRPKK
ncbi:hypothetical protein Pla175_44790 [Pirellulimonas nuda]|uniref:Uncharacterized protein n=1 Tax=Pirellulimonas nuda TaxID=2528009 RepID=A0A518DI45_9BACT|nr:collagen-binding domain-containing protein [Pirellulimonas nuda]QDU91062.1 hypothetical protein Pla175_44790 [Pirellulimonas nuda]